MEKLFDLLRATSALSGANATYIEQLYEKYLQHPESVDETWQAHFDALSSADDVIEEIPHTPVREHFKQLGNSNRTTASQQPQQNAAKQAAVTRLIDSFRTRGHQQANNNPLKDYRSQQSIPDLDPAYYGLTALDMETVFHTDNLYWPEDQTLSELLQQLRKTYCGSIGCEFMHIVDSRIKRWVINQMEAPAINYQLTKEQKIHLLQLLTAAEGIEKYLHRRYVGQKRFSLEGGESLIPILDELIQLGGETGVREFVIGMAHRGRLNVLVNILGKNPSLLFQEFEGTNSSSTDLSGDVKYHMGFSSDISTAEGAIHLTLAFNPSHLEIINPVVEGSVKARQDRLGKGSIDSVIPILIHGDAAFAGQGVVMETLNMAETRAFSTGGTVHLVINNQIGFTTSNPFDARSTLYCTDVANMIQAPVFHVNGDDPEAVIRVTKIAMEYRRTFHKDVVIDLLCYRRHGHNEADEPSVTQPMMYNTINNHPTTRQLYASQLEAENVITAQTAEQMEQDYVHRLESGDAVSRPLAPREVYPYTERWNQFLGRRWDMPCNTSIPLEKFRALSNQLLELPKGFELHPRVAKIMENRTKMAAGALPIDWGFAENLAYASILDDGHNVRLVGQDSGRGTFFHRHAIIHHRHTGEAYIPLKNLQTPTARPQIFDSLLSEEGVLGFEYGYSTTEPETLVIWEAQFGDFANGAQVVIDQFISSGEKKWGRMSGLTMLLPHGYEGQGPEHSSARLERYLQLCAQHNLQVCMPTTPAQIFHLLRRQILRRYRKPLIIMSPKSLLRHKLAISSLESFSNSLFQPLIPEIDSHNPEQISRAIVCSGKVYYDLLEARREAELNHIVILRAEQLYPFPLTQLNEQLARYPSLKTMVWCQEEPKNQGAWYQIRHRFFDAVKEKIQLEYAGRPMSAAPAVGYFRLHVEQQKAVVRTALYGQQKN